MSVTARPVSPGMEIRMNRVFPRSDGRSLILPMDHGITHGVSPGMESVRSLVTAAVSGGADAILLRPGLMRSLAGLDLGAMGLVIALTGRLSGGVDHVALNTVEEAVRAGADCVAVELKLGSPGELDNARTVSRLREEAHLLGLPVLVMVYPVAEFIARKGAAAYVHACRIGEELGGDLVKTGLPDEEVLTSCLAAVNVPLIVAGGTEDDFEKVCARISSAVRVGASGAAVGRNVFGRPDQGLAVRQLSDAVHH